MKESADGLDEALSEEQGVVKDLRTTISKTTSNDLLNYIFIKGGTDNMPSLADYHGTRITS